MNRSRIPRYHGIIWAAGIALLLWANPAQAAKKCYDCHKKQETEFSSRKNVHQPVKDENCEVCHKRHGFANSLILVDQTAQLCYSCHKDVKDKFAVGTQHFPVEKGICWDCHDPHSSDKHALLKKGPEGADDPDACLQCHKDDLTTALNGKVPHEPFAKQNCVACHEAHNSLHPALLKADAKTLCVGCHNLADKNTQKAHAGKHAENLSCVDCHSGHSSNNKGLMSERTHAPVAAGDCETCHSLPDSANKVTFAEGVTPGNICANCHADEANGSKKSFPHAAVESANCDNCHDSHSSRYPHLLKQDELTLCSQCHADVIGGKSLTPHSPAMDGKCGSCHEIHGSDHKSLLKKSDASLCLDCHKDFATARDSAKVVHAGAEDCLQCHNPHQGLTANVLRKDPSQLCSDCHAPDQASAGMASQHIPYMTKDCAACHVPHYSNRDHLVREESPKLCVQCHPEIVDRTKMKVPHPPATEDCRTCHVPHFSAQDNLLNSPEKQLCESCHDSTSLNLTKEFVHTPAAEGDCAGCHNPHGSMRDKLLTGRAQKIVVNGIPVSRTPNISEKRADLCYTCHENLVEAFRKQGVHKPVEQGKCDACHAPHGSDHAGFVKDSAAALCGACHTVDSTLSAKHNNYNLAGADCLDCHNPHISGKPKLLRANSHPPYEEKSCDACHTQGPDGKVKLAGAVNEVCASCHETSKEEATKKFQHPPFEAGECTSCHSAHGSDNAMFLKRNGNDLCLSCHSDFRELAKEPVVHQPFKGGKCVDCHVPHASNNEKLTVKPIEALCLTCHTDLKKKMADGTVHAPARNGQCLSCHQPHAGKQPALLVKAKQQLCTGCHDLTGAVAVAAHKGFPMTDADCQNCHAAHVGRKGDKALLLPERHKPFAAGDCNVCHEATGKRALMAASPQDLCLKCHNTFASNLQKPFVHAPLNTPDGCIKCHGPHVGYGKAIQKKDGVQTCLTCHNNAEFTGTNKHQAAFEDCTTCHTPHSGDNKMLLVNTNIMELCMTCHDDALQKHYHPMGDKATDPRTHQPLNCVGCHSPHSSNYTAILLADKDRRLCVMCHDLMHEEH